MHLGSSLLSRTFDRMTGSPVEQEQQPSAGASGRNVQVEI